MAYPSNYLNAEFDIELNSVFIWFVFHLEKMKSFQQQFEKTMTAQVSQIASRAYPNFDVRLLHIIPEFDGNHCRLHRYMCTATDLS